MIFFTGEVPMPFLRGCFRLSKGDVNLSVSVEFFLKKAYSEAEAVDKTANNIVTY